MSKWRWSQGRWRFAPARETLASHQQINRRDKHEEITTELPISERADEKNAQLADKQRMHRRVLILLMLFDRFAELNHTFASTSVSTEEIIRIVNDDWPVADTFSLWEETEASHRHMFKERERKERTDCHSAVRQRALSSRWFFISVRISSITCLTGIQRTL